MNYDEIVNKFTDVKPKPGGGVMVKCPAHDDDKQSLGIDQGDDGRVLVKCFAGCQTADVIRAAGLTMADLMPPKRQEARPKIVATYDYCNLSDALLYQVVRYDQKDFRQRRPDGRGGWIWSLKGVERVPYRLRELVAAVGAGRTVFLPEGEKDVDNLRRLGLVATCNAGGAGKWDASFGKWLRGADVVIPADNDDPGRKHAADVARKLTGSARSIKILNLPGLPLKGDISDWISAGGTREQLEKLVADTPEWTEAPGVEVKTEWTGPRPMTDLGAAERYRDQHIDGKLYDVRHGGWRVWDGKRWPMDSSGAVARGAHETARSIYDEAKAAAAKDPDLAQALAKFAARCEQKERLKAMVEVAKDLEGMVIDPALFDADPWLLNCQNGTLDLRTGELRPHDKGDYITKLAEVDFIPAATHPILDKVLADALPDIEARTYCQKVFGYALCGDKREKLMGFIYGPKDSAKSTLCDPFHHLLGDYSATAEPETFTVKTGNNRGAVTPELARLAGVRLVLTSETNENHKLDSGLVKRMTGGDNIVARNLYSSPFEFRPQFLIVLMSNHRPIVPDSDDAVWVRLRVIPFDQTIPEDKKDPNVKRTLENDPAARSALLAWAVEGCLLWQREGLKVPEAVRVATGQYREAMDCLGDFLTDCCVLGPDHQVDARSLRQAYEDWAHEIGLKATLAPNKFAEKLKARGCTPGRSMKGRYWDGIGLVHDTHDTHDGTFCKTPLRNPHEKSLHNMVSYPSCPSCEGENPIQSNPIQQPRAGFDGWETA